MEHIKMARDYDKTLFRLISILQKLSDDELYTAQELAEEFSVTLRTIQRDIQRLGRYPIVKNHQKQLKFQDGFSINRGKLSISEIATLSLSLELIKNKGDEFFKSSKDLTTKFLMQNVVNPYYIKPNASEKIDTDSFLLNKIEEAIEYKNIIEVTYVSGKIQKIEPFKIINFDGFWYLLAKIDDEVLIDRISNIKTVKVLSARYAMDDDEKKLFQKLDTPFFKHNLHVTVVIKVEKNIAEYFELKKYLPSQKVLETLADGSVLLQYEVSNIEEVDNLVKSWLPDIEVIEPISYRDKFLGELRSYIEKCRC